VNEDCIADWDKFGGVICNNNVQIRAVPFLEPGANVRPMFMMLNWDDSVINNMNSTELEEYEGSHLNYGMMNRKCTGDWSVPFVTGHKYKF